MRFAIRPFQEPQRELDLTHRLVSAVAEELWSHYGGNEQLNWLEAELHLQRLFGQARPETGETALPAVTPVAAGSSAGEMPGGSRGHPAGRRRGLSPSMDRSAGRARARRGEGGHRNGCGDAAAGTGAQ
jgi:hypothetical protein